MKSSKMINIINEEIKNFLKDNNTHNRILPEFFYHGSNKYFNKFSLDYLGQNWEQSILGIYFTQYLKPPPYGSTAIEYANNLVITKGGEPYVYKCKINSKNPLILNSKGWYSSNTFIDKNRNQIKSIIDTHNYDAVIAYDFSENEIKYRDYILITNYLDIVQIVDILKINN